MIVTSHGLNQTSLMMHFTESTINYLEMTTDFTVTVEYDYPLVDELVCANSFSIEINTCEITIPNVFTPNADGENDRWLIDGLVDSTELNYISTIDGVI